MATIKPGFNIDEHCDKLASSGTEHAHQRAFFQWLHWADNGLPPLMGKLAFAVPNGGKRDKITAARLSVEGVKSGVPDVVIPYPVPHPLPGGNSFWRHGLYVELKVDTNTTSETQDIWLEALDSLGYSVAVCWGWRAARQAVLDYIGGRDVQRKYR